MYSSNKDKLYSVYVHKFPNGKMYIGITCMDVNKRWNYGKGYKKQPLIHRAIEKYGWDNIKHIVMYKNFTYEDAVYKEKLLIRLFNTNSHNLHSNGYNCDDGGEGAVGHIVSDETRAKMKIAQIKSPETREKISKTRKERKIVAWNKGKKMSEEWKQLHPNASPIRWDSTFNPRSKPVIYLDKVYPSKRKCWEENFSDISTYDNFKYQLKRLANGKEILDEKYKHFHLEISMKFN